MPKRKSCRHEYRVTAYTNRGEMVTALRVQTSGDAGDALGSAIQQYQIPRENSFVVEYMGDPGTILSMEESIKFVRKHFAKVFKKEGIDIMMEGP